MYPTETVATALALVEAGWNYSEISRELGVSRAAIRSWAALGRVPTGSDRERCPVCREAYAEIPPQPYAYLLGQYLGDGCLTPGRRGVYLLRIACANAWPGVMADCVQAIREIRPHNVVRVVTRVNNESSYVSSRSKHWICLLPQHDAGRKHLRSIQLELWQQDIVDAEPAMLLRGLFHSDGCRSLNHVNGSVYPRWLFSNVSKDILRLMGETLDKVGVEWRLNRYNSLSVAKRASVARLDELIGPKY